MKIWKALCGPLGRRLHVRLSGRLANLFNGAVTLVRQAQAHDQRLPVCRVQHDGLACLILQRQIVVLLAADATATNRQPATALGQI